MIDPLFKVKLIAQSPAPQLSSWIAMHQDYCENFVADHPDNFPGSEAEAGEKVIRHLLANERGHFGPLEHNMILFNVGYFPHSVLVQARTHRVGVSFDAQSMRYTGKRMVGLVQRLGDSDDLHNDCAKELRKEIEELFYVRPPGFYTDRQGKKYEYTEEERIVDLISCYRTAQDYHRKILRGAAEEDARGLLASDYRQHFVASFSLRALMHFLDLRAKKDAQLEIQQLCELMWPHFEAWTPEIAGWYKEKRWGKARLSP